jgi:hypothetical protein
MATEPPDRVAMRLLSRNGRQGRTPCPRLAAAATTPTERPARTLDAIAATAATTSFET